MIPTSSATHRRIAATLALAAGFFLFLFIFLEPVSTAAGPNRPVRNPASPAAVLQGSANCRAGVSLGTGDTNTQMTWIPTFGVGWYLNFGLSGGVVPGNVEFVPMIGVFQVRDGAGNRLPAYRTLTPLTASGLGARIIANPGALWIIGNEVDRIGQGDMMPDIYARAYHDIYHFIKSYDVTAQVAPSGLVEVTPGRLQYLDLVWNAYYQRFGVPLPVDAWTMHLYILPELFPDGVTPNNIASVAVGTDPALGKVESGNNPALCPQDRIYCFAEHDDMGIFGAQVRAMRTWMRDHNYRHKPLLLTEYSILYPYEIDAGGCFLRDEYGQCFTPQRVSQFVVNSFNYMVNATDPQIGFPADGNRLVQQWLWYSLNTDVAGDASDLLTEDLTGLTLVGQTYRDAVLGLPLTVNLVAMKAGYPVATTASPGGTAAVPLSVTIGNNGNTGVDRTYVVTFYADQALLQPIGSAVAAPQPGCARHTRRVTFTWTGRPAGVHPYWVKVDSLGTIVESNENDNVTGGFALVNPAASLFQPAVRR